MGKDRELSMYKGNWHIYGQAYHFMLRTAMTNYTHNSKGLAAGCHSKNNKIIKTPVLNS